MSRTIHETGQQIDNGAKRRSDGKALGDNEDKDRLRINESVIHLLLTAGAITKDHSVHPANSSVRPFAINLGRAIQVLDPIPAIPEWEAGVDELARIESEAQNLLPRVQNAFVQLGILPSRFIGDVNRLFTTEDVTAVNRDAHCFRFLDDSLPPPGEKRAEIEIGASTIRYSEENLKKTLEKSGVILTPETIRELALIQGLSHEYGHAIANTLVLKMIEPLIAAQPNDRPIVLITAEDIIAEVVHTKVAPDAELSNLLGDEIDPKSLHSNIEYLTSERVATGFEIAGLQFVLEDRGLSSTQVQAVLMEDSNIRNNILVMYPKAYTMQGKADGAFTIWGNALKDLEWN